jgi:hypothetical protein
VVAKLITANIKILPMSLPQRFATPVHLDTPPLRGGYREALLAVADSMTGH